jgi:hypothetical protein
MLEQHAARSKTSSSIAVSMDTKLDTMLEKQDEMMDLEKQQLAAQGKTNVKVDVLLDMVSDIDPTNAARKLQFSITAWAQIREIGHLKGIAVFCESQEERRNNKDFLVFTRQDSFDDFSFWERAAEKLSPQKVLSQEEYTWLGKYLNAKIRHDFGVTEHQKWDFWPKSEISAALTKKND